MKNIFKNIILLATALLCSCGDFDDSDLRDRIDGYKKRIEVLQKKAETLNTQIEALSHLTNGNVITSVTQNSDGKYVITYKDDKDAEYSVVLATMDDLLDVPVLGVKLDEEEGIYYWTQYADGQTDWLRKGESGERIPVRGNTPTLSVDADGYWTVNGERILDGDNKPIEANTDSSSVFKAASYEDGVFTLTLGNGEVLSLQVFNTLNLKLQTTATVTIVDAEAGCKIKYELTGEAKDKALIAIAKEAGGAKAAIDREEQTINVAFDSEFSDRSNGHIIVMAYDLADNVVVKPVFFTKAKDTRIFISSADELVQFAADVNAGAIPEGMQIFLTKDIDMSSAADWTPIGNGTFSGTAFAGAAFSGTFDGQGYAVKNLKIKNEAAPAQATVGLFGLLNNATVKNVVLGEGSSIDVKSTDFLSVGGIAAAAVGNTTIDNCENRAAIKVETGIKDKRIEVGGILGAAHTDATDIVVKGCRNYGAMSSVNTLSSNNGANGIQLGGIVGFVNGTSSGTCYTRISNCENHGEFTVQAARTGGIAGALNYRGAISNCTNDAALTNTEMTASNCRTAGIASFITNGSSIEQCVNNGDITFAVAGDTTHGYAAGIVGQMQVATTSVIGCENCGSIRSDIIKAAANKYIAVICSNTNKTACIIKDNKIGGKIGPYTEDDTYTVTDITADNFSNYIFFHLAGTDPTLDNNVFAGSAPVRPEATLRILCIGNSFTKDAVEHLPKMIAAAGINTVKIVHMYYGGRTIPEYYNGYATVSDYTCYTLYPDTDVWVSTKNQTLQQAVKSDKWDIVTLQEHTGNYRAWSWTDEEKNSIVGMINYIKADQDGAKPRIEYIMSQAYFNMGKIGAGSLPYKTFTTQDEMFDVIVEQAKKILAETEVDEIIPTGTVLQNLRTSSLDNAMNLTRDGYHMDYGISRYAAACAVFEMLISPAFGDIKLDDNSFRYTVSDTSESGYSTPVTDVNRLTALQAARYAIADPFRVTDMAVVPSNGIKDIPFQNDTDKE